MDNKARNKKFYMDARAATGCSQNDWARLFNLEPSTGAKHGQKGQPNVAAKESGSKGVNLPEALASELLRYLYSQGHDIKNIEFSESGEIINIPKAK